MVYPHSIRLRGPWHCEPLARTVLLSDGSTRQQSVGLPPGGRTEMPADWHAALGADFRGVVRYRRRFGCPSGLSAQERVWLVIESVNACGHVALSGRRLGTLTGDSRPVELDITAQLEPRNELTLEVQLPPGEKGPLPLRPFGEIRLEIRDNPAGS